MKALTFFIQLREPLLMAKAQNDEPNSSSTELFIPGSAIRGALIGKYLDRSGNRNLDLLQDSDAKRLFFNNEVFFLNAYLAHMPSRTRLLPRPLSWFVKKDDRHKRNAVTNDFAVALSEEVESPKTPQTGEFVYHAEEKIFLASPQKKTMVHNLSIDRNRKGETISNVFRYDSLSEGQWFAGAIISENDGALTALRQLLQARDFKVGGSHTGGYGWIRIEAITPENEEQEYNDWKEYEPREPEQDEDKADPEKIIITLLSDAIVRDRNGQINGDFDEGLAFALELEPGAVRHEKAYQEHKLVGGFNRKWGLPLPQAMAIKAGSVFVYDKRKIDAVKLQKVVERGLGERRNEGFGRIAVNWYTAKQWKQGEFAAGGDILERPELRENSESFKLAARMAESRLRARLDQELIRLISQVDWKRDDNTDNTLKNLSPAQLSQIRIAAKQAINLQSLKSLGDKIDQIEQLKSARERWERVRLGEERLLQWIKNWISLSKDDFENQFDLKRNLPQVAGVTAKLTPKTQQEYCARVIDGVLKKAIKELQRREDDDGK